MSRASGTGRAFLATCCHMLPFVFDLLLGTLLACSLPGSVVERKLQDSISRMFPELLRFSSSSRLLEMVPEDLKNAHRPAAVTEAPVPVQQERRAHNLAERIGRRNAQAEVAPAPPLAVDLWDGWGAGAGVEEDIGSAGEPMHAADLTDSDDDFDLTEMGM